MKTYSKEENKVTVTCDECGREMFSYEPDEFFDESNLDIENEFVEHCDDCSLRQEFGDNWEWE